VSVPPLCAFRTNHAGICRRFHRRFWCVRSLSGIPCKFANRAKGASSAAAEHDRLGEPSAHGLVLCAGTSHTIATS
jgi:hypothetical protein